LYASGVIVPVVDFTQAAEGSQLPSNLQNAWDFSSGNAEATGGTNTIITNSGFWRVQGATVHLAGGATNISMGVYLTDGLSIKWVWKIQDDSTSTTSPSSLTFDFIVFLRPQDECVIRSDGSSSTITATYRQVATLNGDLINPSGFSSS